MKTVLCCLPLTCKQNNFKKITQVLFPQFSPEQRTLRQKADRSIAKNNSEANDPKSNMLTPLHLKLNLTVPYISSALVAYYISILKLQFQVLSAQSTIAKLFFRVIKTTFFLALVLYSYSYQKCNKNLGFGNTKRIQKLCKTCCN